MAKDLKDIAHFFVSKACIPFPCKQLLSEFFSTTVEVRDAAEVGRHSVEKDMVVGETPDKSVQVSLVASIHK